MKTSSKVILISILFLAAGGAIYYFTRKKTTGTAAPGSLTADAFANNGIAAVLPDLSAKATSAGTGTNGSVVLGEGKPVEVYKPAAPVPVKVDDVRDSYMRSLTGYISDPKYLAAFNKMSNDELSTAWYYVGTYLSTGTELLNDTRKLPSGEWDNSNPGNPGLFKKITAIRNKYGIF